MARLRAPGPLLTVLVFAVFGATLGAEYLRWDDRQHIFENPWFKDETWSMFWTQSYYGLYVPVIYSLWGLLYSISQEPWIFHLLNLLLHSLNSWMIYKWCLRWNDGDGRSALLAAAVFAVHPLQVEGVAWISGARDLLATTFALAAVLRLNPDLTKSTWRELLQSWSLFALGMLCKPTIAPLPLAMAVIHVMFSEGPLKERVRPLWRLSGWMIAALILGAAVQRIQSFHTEIRVPRISFWQKSVVVADSIGFYLQKLVWPWSLSGDYGRTPSVVWEEELWKITLPLALAAMGALIFFRVNRKIKVALIMALLFAAPTLGLISFQAQFNSTVADRYMYLPFAALALALACALRERRTWRIVTTALLVVWSGLSFARARVFRNDETFYTDMWRYSDHNYNAAVSLGVVMLTSGRDARAEEWLLTARTLNPRHITAVNALGTLYFLSGRGAKVLSDLEPLVRDPEFMDYNLTETRPMAAFYRLLALCNHKALKWKEAHRYYCMNLAMDPYSPHVAREFEEFRREMLATTGATSTCPVMRNEATDHADSSS
jgi:hypothetical protein